MGTGGKKKLDQTRHCGGSRVSDNETYTINGQSLHFLHVWEDVGVRVCKHAKQNI